jgi:hypothetical protein
MSTNGLSTHVKQSGYVLFRVADLACYPVIFISLLVTSGTRISRICSPDKNSRYPGFQAFDILWVVSAFASCPSPQPWDTRWYLHWKNDRLIFDRDNVVIEEISGLYGPGAQIAWLLTTLSVIATLVLVKYPNEHSNGSKFGINPDIIASVMYTFFASVDLLHQSFSQLLWPRPLTLHSAALTVWTAIILLLATISLFRTKKRPIEMWQIVFYSTLWMCILSYLLSRKWLLFDASEFSELESQAYSSNFIAILNVWIKKSEVIFRFCLSIPMLLYFFFASKVRSTIWKALIMISFILFYTVILDILLDLHETVREHYLPNPTPEELPFISGHRVHPDYFRKAFRRVIPLTSHSLTDLDQMTALVTTAVILAWQWNVWRFPITLAVKIKEALMSRISPGRPSAEEPAIDLESLSSRHTGIEQEV